MKNTTAYLLGAATAGAAVAASRQAGLAPDLHELDRSCPPAPVINKSMRRIACIGDSITFGDGVFSTREFQSYPAVLQGLLEGQLQVLNYGVCGATAENDGDKPYKKQLFIRHAIKSYAETYLIMLGTNDTKIYNWDAEEFEEDLFELVQMFRYLPHDPKIVLMVPPAAFPEEETGEVAFDIRADVLEKEVLPIVKRIAEKTESTLVDLYEVTKDHPEYFTDGVHPNAPGNRAIAKAIFETVEFEVDE